MVCVKCDPFQYRRLRRKIRVVFWDGKEEFECERLFCCFNTEIIDHVKAKEKYICLHGNYKDMYERGQIQKELLPIKKGCTYLACSQIVADSWEELTGHRAITVYNPIALQPPATKLIRVCAAQRMSKEKGADRIKRLVREMDVYIRQHPEYDYLLDIFTNDYGNSIFKNNQNPRIGVHKPLLTINRLFGFYDWFLCLSDNEGYGYSPVEALIRGCPCVVSDLPIFDELGYTSHNSIRLKLDLSNIKDVVNKMFTKELTFTYAPKNDHWGDYIIDTPTTYHYEEENMARIKALMNYTDTFEKQNIQKGDVYETTEERAKTITETVFVNRRNNEGTRFATYTEEPVNVSWQEEGAVFQVSETPKKRGRKRKNVSEAE